MEILTDLSHGLSRSEIAASRGLSINNVKMVINNVYEKLGVENLADLIRVAVERKLI
jgi:DNA-binding NarL/FixJ family response regulator